MILIRSVGREDSKLVLMIYIIQGQRMLLMMSNYVDLSQCQIGEI